VGARETGATAFLAGRGRRGGNQRIKFFGGQLAARIDVSSRKGASVSETPPLTSASTETKSVAA